MRVIHAHAKAVKLFYENDFSLQLETRGQKLGVRYSIFTFSLQTTRQDMDFFNSSLTNVDYNNSLISFGTAPLVSKGDKISLKNQVTFLNPLLKV
jgi:hypothetical protein